MILVDSHCHLNFPDFKEDLDAVVSRARVAGVGVMQTICTDLAEFDEVLGIAERYEGIYCSVGVHPNEAGQTEVAKAEDLIHRARHEKVIGIGETGLDYYYENSPKDLQKASFKAHILASQETGLPLIVHARNADEDIVEILSHAMKEKPFNGLIHCFTSTSYLAEESVKLGFYISLSGIITFKNAQAIRDAIKNVPLDRLLVETDAPYLAPTPHRGKRNEPAYVVNTNLYLATVKNISEEECATLTTNNFFRLFNKAKRPEGV